VILGLLMAVTPSAFVFADATWTPAANDWVTGANWLPATAPGMISGTVLNTDTATFSSTLGHTFTTVSVDNNRNLQNITFDAAAEAYTLMFTSSIFTFLLTAGGAIQNDSSTANSQNINLNTQLNGAYTFNSNSNVSGNIYTMNFGKSFVSDSITQAVTGALTLGGTNTGNNTISTDLKDGAGTLSLVKTGAGTWVLSGANTYSGATNINGGVLQISAANNLGNGAASNVIGFNNNGILESTGNTYDLGASRTITLNGAGTIESDSGTLTVSGAVTNGANLLTVTGAGAVMFTGGIGSGTGGLTKTGTGMLILNGNNSYAGTTTINGGTLRITTATGLGTTAGGVSVANGATLDLNGTFAVGNEAVTLANGSKLSSSSGANSISGNIGVTGTSTVDVATSLTLSGAVTGSVYPTTIFTKTGTGTLILSGNTDNFDLSAGVNAGTLSLEKTASNAVADLTLTGGTARLNGTDDCQIWDSGVVTINGGTLDMNAHNETIGSLGGSAGTITNSAAATTSILTVGGNGTTATFSGIIENGSGIVGFTKAGGDTFTLGGTATNTYTGLTTVSAGELDLNKTAGINAIGGNLLISGTGTVKLLAADQIANTAAINMTGGTLSLNGMNETVDTFSNSGGIFTTGAGHLTGLGATVTWSGGTNTVNNGGLVADSHIVITSGTNIVEGGAAGGVLALNSGGTGLEMTGATLTLNSDAATAGKLLLQGNVTTYASAVSSNISNGLGLANSGTIDLDNGTRTFTVADGAAANDLVIGAVITNGAVTKAGPGVLTFNGANTYSGITTINAGTLRAGNGNALGTGAGGVINNATLDIGANTLNIGGVYNQAYHSTLKLTINSLSTWGKIVSSADAVVSALSTVNVTIAAGLTIPNNSTFTVVDGAGGPNVNVPGTIISGSSLFELLGSVLNGDLILTAHYASNSAPLYASLTTDSNGRAVGNALDNISNPSGDMTTVLSALAGLSGAQAAKALDTMVPAVDAGVRDNSTAALNNFIAVSLDRAQSVLALDATGNYTNKCILPGHDDKINGIWAKEYGSHLDQGTRKGIQGYDAWNAGTAIGVDRLFGDTFTLGISGGYAYGNVDSDANNVRTTIDSAQGAVYAGYQGRDIPYFIDAAGSFARNWYTAKRDIDVGAINRIADSKYDGLQYGAYLGGGYNFELEKNIEVTPLVSIQWDHLGLFGYTENNAGAMDLSVNRQSYDMLQSGLGVSAASCVQYKWGNFTPELHAKWLYDFIGDSVAVTSAYAGGGSFTANGAKSAANSANLGGKLFFDFKNDISLIAQCDTQIKNKFFGVYGSVTVRYRF